MNKNKHLTIAERNAILLGIQNGSTLAAIAKTIGKDPTTVKKEIILHRQISYRSSLPLECTNYKNCKNKDNCSPKCIAYIKFKCKRRDKTPGACNGCSYMHKCRFTKYKYDPSDAQHNYEIIKVTSREGYNLTEEETNKIALIVKPLLQNGQSPYQIIENNKELNISEKTLYNYIEQGVLKPYGIDAFLLRRQLSRKLPKEKKNQYKKRNDYSYLQGRKYSDFQYYKENNPNVSVVQMDTVYNDVSNGPFIQTFKFMSIPFLIAFYHETKTQEAMINGVNQLEKVLGKDLFKKYVQIILTDRGSEFICPESFENDVDGVKRTMVFYCDPMASYQKGSLENSHIELRYHFPNETDLRSLGLTSQEALNLSLSHINSMALESLHGKSNFDYLTFLCPDLLEKIKEFGIIQFLPNSVILNPTIFKK